MDQACPSPPCPVADEQRPLRSTANSVRPVFFTGGKSQASGLIRPLAWCWLIKPALSLLNLLMASWPLRHNLPGSFLVAAVFAVLPAVFFVLRQWLGWSYVHRRLRSERWSTKNPLV